jgi:hypothetical protein
MEWDLRRPDAPYIIKSPWLCDYLDEALDSGEYIIDHAIIPMRDLYSAAYSAAESRRDVVRRTEDVLAPDEFIGTCCTLLERVKNTTIH